MGPVAFVKEQVPLQYATRLAAQGFATLIFDPRFHGESEGEPRRFESPAAKIEDIAAAIDFLVTCAYVDASQIFVLGVCQGVNWTIEAALVDSRIRAVALVAGHYLTPAVARMYLGEDAQVEARLARGHAAEAKFKATGEIDYTPIIASSFSTPNPDALLMAPFVQSFYHRWADRHAMLAHRGLWENRITTMSEHLIWGHRTDISIGELMLPVLVYPMIIPVLIGAILLTNNLIAGGPLDPENLIWFRVLVAFDLIFTLLALVLVETVLVG